MSNQNNHSVGASGKSFVLAAMMDDLGVGRLENLATEDEDKLRRNQGTRPQREWGALSEKDKARANSYRDALGKIDDWDARGMKDLDSIANGNLHRQNQNGHHNHQYSTSRTLNDGFDNIKPIQSIKKHARLYDASHPTYSNTRSKMAGNSGQLHGSDPHVSSLGGLVPPGASVKRWDPSGVVRPSSSGQITTRQPAQTQAVPASATGAQQRIPGPAPVSRAGVSDRASGANSREQATRRAATSKPDVAPVTRFKQTATITDSSVGRLPHHQKHTQSPESSNNHPSSPASSSPGVNEAARPNFPRPKTLQGSQGSRASRQTSHSPGHIPPHLRVPPNKVTDPQAPVPAAPASAVPTSSAKSLASPPQTVLSAASLEAREIFFQSSVKLKKRVNGSIVDILGKVSIYELADQPVAIWELIIDEQQVVRADIRRLIPSFIDGSTVTIRRQDKPGSEVKSGDVRFDGILAAQEFERVAKYQRKRWAESPEPIFDQTLQKKASTTTKDPVVIEPSILPNSPSQGERQELNAKSTTNPNSAELIELLEDEPTAPQPGNEHDTNETCIVRSTSPIPEPEQLLIDFEEETPSPQEIARLLPSLVSPTETETLIDLSILAEQTMTTSSYMDQLLELDSWSWELKKAPALSGSFGAAALGFSLNIQPPIEKTETSPSQQFGVDKEVESSFLNLKANDSDPFAKNLSQDSLKFLHGLSVEANMDMIRAVPNLTDFFNEAKYSPPGQVNRSNFAAFQVAWKHLRRLDEYHSLTSEDKQVVLSVVYATVLHAQGRIVRPLRHILDLRGPRQPCPHEIRELNELVRNSNRLQNVRSTMFSRSIERTEPQRLSDHSNETIEEKAREQTKTPTMDEPMSTSRTSLDEDEDEDTPRRPSAWDSIGLEESIEPEVPSAALTLPSTFTAVNENKPIRNLSSSRWAPQAYHQQQSRTQPVGLDGTSSDAGDIAPWSPQAPSLSGHRRTDTNDTHVSGYSDMTGLANRIKSTPTSCLQS